MSTHEPHDEARIREYLLGRLDERDAEAVETRYFSDDVSFAQVEAIADALCDDEVRGLLPQADRARLRELSHQLDWHVRLKVAEAIRRELAQAAVADNRSAAARTRSSVSIAEWFLSLRMVPRLSMAAATVVLMLGWLLFALEARKWSRESAETRVQMQSDVAAARAATAAAEARTVEQQSRISALEKSLAERATLALVLMPGLTRDGGETVIVPRAIAFVRIQLALERPLSPGTAYRAALQTADAATVWSEQNAVASAGSGLTPVVTIPAGALRGGRYVLRLSAAARTGGFEEIARYPFHVTRR